ncbi:methyltransferase domain-containing protein [Celeribacter arenosi]|uniref:Class I SAM-dependent methyltransferase n=1 Tax=Celeribacter arenosi TaxID=792649 RepID=A0ABP7KDT9_9RHOB
MTRSDHWDTVYADKDPTHVSWYQERPDASLDMIARAGTPRGAPVLDVGAGAGFLVDHLIAAGFTDITALDLSASALAALVARLEAQAIFVETVAGDITQWVPDRAYALWHDRAAFHFLTDAGDRAAYVARMETALPRGAQAVIATFDADGPTMCSGLPVVRYSPAALAEVIGPSFRLVESCHVDHATPRGGSQKFQFSRFERL